MVDTSAFDQPEARGLRLIIGTLRVTTAAQCFGAAGEQLLAGGTSAVATLVAAGRDLDAGQLGTLDRVLGGALAAAAMFSLTRPCWPVLLPVVTFFAADEAARLSGGEEWWRMIGVVSAAATVVVPATLMLVDLYPPKAKFSLARFLIGGLLLRVASAATFLGLGAACLYHSRAGGGPAAVAHTAGWVISGETLPEDGVAYGLQALGALLAAGAINLLAARTRGVAAAMAVLGLVVAGTAVFEFGPAGVLTMLKRIAYAGAPAAVFLYWTLSIREHGGRLRPRGE